MQHAIVSLLLLALLAVSCGAPESLPAPPPPSTAATTTQPGPTGGGAPPPPVGNSPMVRERGISVTMAEVDALWDRLAAAVDAHGAAYGHNSTHTALLDALEEVGNLRNRIRSSPAGIDTYRVDGDATDQVIARAQRALDELDALTESR